MKAKLLSLSLILLLVTSACTMKANEHDDVTTLQIKDLVEGEGEPVVVGDTVEVHYKGMLTDGTVFDSSYDRGKPATFPLGIGYLILGWEQGIPGMKVGGKRELVIPPDLAYGSAGVPDANIPPDATLVFEIELIEIK
ncbi:MAG: FKBP-type peptidyl-prolyl cis-trans isomerase [Patescibacteria group bacterium]